VRVLVPASGLVLYLLVGETFHMISSRSCRSRGTRRETTGRRSSYGGAGACVVLLQGLSLLPPDEAAAVPVASPLFPVSPPPPQEETKKKINDDETELTIRQERCFAFWFPSICMYVDDRPGHAVTKPPPYHLSTTQAFPHAQNGMTTTLRNSTRGTNLLFWFLIEGGMAADFLLIHYYYRSID